MLEKLKAIEERLTEVERQLSDPAAVSYTHLTLPTNSRV